MKKGESGLLAVLLVFCLSLIVVCEAEPPFIQAAMKSDAAKVLESRGLEELVSAIQQGDHVRVEEIASEMISLDVFWSDRRGNRLTPLIIAANKGETNIARVLLDHGANPSLAPPKTRSAPIHYASFFGHDEIVALLIERGADINAINSRGWSPLIGALGRGHRTVVKLLLSNGADTSKLSSAERAAIDRLLDKSAEPPDKSPMIVLGTLLERSETMIVVKAGVKYKFPIQQSTKILNEDGKPISIGALRIGKPIQVFYQGDQVLKIVAGPITIQKNRSQ